MVQAIAVIFNHYLSIPFEDFTAKAISALGVLGCMNPDDVSDDINEIKRIIDITDEKLYFSMYVIDRWVNPDSVIDKVLTLKLADSAPDELKIKYRNGRTFTKDSGADYFLQRKLCEAIAEIHLIVMRNVKRYNVNFEVGGDLNSM